MGDRGVMEEEEVKDGVKHASYAQILRSSTKFDHHVDPVIVKTSSTQDNTNQNNDVGISADSNVLKSSEAQNMGISVRINGRPSTMARKPQELCILEQSCSLFAIKNRFHRETHCSTMDKGHHPLLDTVVLTVKSQVCPHEAESPKGSISSVFSSALLNQHQLSLTLAKGKEKIYVAMAYEKKILNL
ncbi:hypothetical protein AMTR_s00075p00033280 [Amborella trichopoda]|uniref:Uncharacterized protein n=1 Tax=Amborella trichopoda TaxID=13333 RepID=W1PA37_AMBTC|nr:hypothetical protein AMTR_s00075p00033280 [Amborella trichopoda]